MPRWLSNREGPLAGESITGRVSLGGTSYQSVDVPVFVVS